MSLPCKGGAAPASSVHLVDSGEPIALVPVELAPGGGPRVELDVDAVDWSNLQPHPRLGELAVMCMCGADLGEHLVEPPNRRAPAAWPCNHFWRAGDVVASADATKGQP